MTVGIYRLAGAVISLALLLAPLTEASGQRTVPGQWLGDAGVSVPLAPGSPASGAWVRAGRYLAGSYWSAGARLAPVSPDGEAGSLLLSGGMMWRLAATRDRLLGLYAGGDVFVDSACRIALEAGLSDKFVAITILAGGTSMPELVTCVVAAAKNKGALALGNIIGSNISNILLILGASALACPLTFANMKVVDLGVITLSSVMLLVSAWTGRDNKISRWDGASYLLIFAAYMAYLILTI